MTRGPVRRQLTSAYRTQIAEAARVWTSNVTILEIRAGSVLMDTAVDMKSGDDPAAFTAGSTVNNGSHRPCVCVYMYVYARVWTNGNQFGGLNQSVRA